MRGTPLERFSAKVDFTDTCWLWTGRIAINGYSQWNIDKKTWSGHKWIYEQIHGPVAAGMHLDHLCRTRSCVNPDHLEPVTPRENHHRSPITNYAKDACPKGHPYSLNNTYIRPSTGSRMCRTCGRRWANAANARRREAAKAIA